MTLRSLALVTGLTCAIAACDGLMKSDPAPEPPAQQKRAPAGSDAQFEADIMVGRVEVMQDQTARGLEVLGAGRPADAELPSDRDTYRRLYDAVERYNALNKSACAGGVAAGNLCGKPPYLPLWYAGRARPDVSSTGLRTMAEDMQDQMIPLWDAVCAKAKAKSGDEHFCAIE
jgi:hypothetical protein